MALTIDQNEISNLRPLFSESLPFLNPVAIEEQCDAFRLNLSGSQIRSGAKTSQCWNIYAPIVAQYAPISLSIRNTDA